MEDCLFCQIIAGQSPSYKLYEDDQTFVFLNIYPVSRGHFLIIPKEHAENVHEGSEAAAEAVMKTMHRLAPQVVKALGASGYNIGMNIGADAGQIIFHTHMHFMPRYADTPRSFEQTKPVPEELEAVAEVIRNAISL